MHITSFWSFFTTTITPPCVYVFSSPFLGGRPGVSSAMLRVLVMRCRDVASARAPRMSEHRQLKNCEPSRPTQR